MIIVKGRFDMDGDVGHYTCQRYNGKSTIDYVLLSATFIPYISNFHVDVFEKNLSDAHSPICLDLIFENPTRKHIKNISDSENDNKQDKHLIEYNHYGMSENMEEFFNSVKYSRFATENIQLRQSSLSNPTQQNIDSCVNNLCNIYIEAGKKTNRCRKTKTNIHHTQRRRYTKKSGIIKNANP